ncbi:MAG: malectin domain-containing carbohydrate-binding protein [Chloroflexota bacterium]|nr:malectin domain-containing carbohydrate-binding protein [Chloroflexota bacterium]
MPQGAAARALLGVIALITIIALAVVPVVDARPKDKKNNDTTTTEVTSDANGDAVSDETASQTTGNGGDERTLLSSDADGDYIPDSLDNCPNVQNPDQSDADGDGAGDACPIYYDTDGDGVADKEDNCPGVSTTDFRDTDGDGAGDPCDKSPDGVEPEPVQVADYVDQGEPAQAEPETVNGANQDGQSIEREGRNRSRQRSRTETSEPVITTGSDGAETADGVSAGDGEAIAVAEDGVGSEGEVITEGPDAQPYEPSGRDNPRRNEELIAEAAASGELYAEPQAPPAAQRAWDEDVLDGDWQVVARIDSGANVSESAQSAAESDTSQSVQKKRSSDKDKQKKKNGKKKNGKKANGKKNQTRDADVENGDAAFARGWALTSVPLQEEVEPGDREPGDDGGVSPVPVENGLVLSGGSDEQPDPATVDSPGAGSAEQVADAEVATERSSKKRDSGKKDGSRRNGSSRAAAAPATRSEASSGSQERKSTSSQKTNKKNANRAGKAKQRKRERNARARQKTEQRSGKQEAWKGDRYFDGGSAVDYRDAFEVAGTDDQDLYLTARTGDGPGKKRGFSYAIPVEGEGSYLVRFYFVEPDDTEVGARVFSVSAEGDDLVDGLDLAAEAGIGTAVVKQAEVRIDDGTLDLDFTASEGAPIISAIEVLEHAR